MAQKQLSREMQDWRRLLKTSTRGRGITGHGLPYKYNSSGIKDDNFPYQHEEN